MSDRNLFSEYNGRYDIFRNNENSRLNTCEEYIAGHRDSTCLFDDIEKSAAKGLPICVSRDGEGKLNVTFTDNTHVLAIGATRSGKTTGYVLPSIEVLARERVSMVISDPKREIMPKTLGLFESQGYRIRVLDFQDYKHSDCWNPLTKYYDMYRKYLRLEDSIKVVEEDGVLYNSFNGTVFHSQEELEKVIAEEKSALYSDIEVGISSVSATIAPTFNTEEPYWENTACALLKGLLLAMLEDSDERVCGNPITRETFSMNTALKIFDSFSDESHKLNDHGYFTDRPRSSAAYKTVVPGIIRLSADVTRSCVLSSFADKIRKFRDSAVSRITCTNTFEFSELDDEEPTVVFLAYKDEDSLHYDIIGMFLTNLYQSLIELARRKNGQLSRAFYFMLDEFGNFPKFKDFDKVISACGGRNIWFMLIVQSYDQIRSIYREATGTIIDNLNMHIFFASNNPETKKAFSEECGKMTVISPMSAVNGSKDYIDRYEKEVVPTVPVSMLNHLKPGECFITSMTDDVLLARIERSYMCPEFDREPVNVYEPDKKIMFSDPKFNYDPEKSRDDDENDDDKWSF